MFQWKRRLTCMNLKTIGLTLFALCVSVPATYADNQVGGHFGAVFAPLISSQDNSTIFDNFSIGFPMGITVKRGDKWAFDLELVTGVDTKPLRVGLTVHPGVLRDLGGHWTVGLRAAFDVSGNAWGLTPLLNKGFPTGNHALFIEGVVPIRFSEDALGDSQSAIGLGIHIGVGF
jgi:hypothetical protein